MKFAKGQKVTVVPLEKRGTILRGFPVKMYAKPDTAHYTVLVADYDEHGDDVVEVSEDELI